jgi:hypothetical protein
MKSKTIIYLLVSALVFLLGLVLLVSFKEHVTMLSISTSIIAGGISSIAFGINRYLEEVDSKKSSDILGQSLEGLRGDLNHLDEALQGIRTLGALATNPNDRRILDRHPDDEFRKELGSIRRNKHIDVDVIGLSLKQFCVDFLDELVLRDQISVRLLVQHPFETTFALVCHQEAREERAMLEEVLVITEKILKLSATMIERDISGTQDIDHARKFEIKWFPLVPSITLTRLNQVMFVRARYLEEANHPPMFFETYYQEEGRCFDSYLVYFNNAWDDGVQPTLELCNKLRERIRQTDVVRQPESG